MKKTIILVLTLALVLVVANVAFARIPTTTEAGKAVTWAVSRMGSTAYSGYCLAFVCDAYQYGVPISITRYADAKTAATSLGAANNPNYSVPKGAFPFWNWYGTIGGVYKNYGHVGISEGTTTMIHAISTVCRQTMSTWNTSTYIGWAWPNVY